MENGGGNRAPAVNKNIITAIIAVLVAAAVIVGAVLLIVNFAGPKGLAMRAAKAFMNGDADKLVKMSSALMLEYSDYNYYDYDEDLEEVYEYEIEDYLDYLEEYVGHSYKLSYELEDLYSLRESKQDELFEEIEDEFYWEDWDMEFDFADVKDVKIAEIVVTAEQGRDEEELELIITMFKERGGWKLVYMPYDMI